MEQVKIPFFTRMKRAIFNPEEYSTFMLEKSGESIKYLLKFLIIFAIIVSIAYTYNFYQKGIGETELNLLRDYGFEESYIEQFQKTYEEINDTYLIIIMFIVNIISLYVAYTISNLLSTCIFGVFGLIIARICGMKIKFSQSFNLAVYAITLPSILLAIYMIANLLFGITVKYFAVAYDAITYIYIITSILMLRTDLIKQKIELAKIMKEQEKVREEMKEHDQEQKEKEEEKEEDNSKEEGEPEGNKA